MKLIVSSDSEVVEVVVKTDDGVVIDTLNIPVGLELEWTVHDDPRETQTCVALDRAFGDGETYEERQRATD